MIVFHLCLAVMALFSASGVTLNINKESSPGTNDLVYIGPIEGRTYLAEVTVFRNWNEAKEYCKNANMSLATIEKIEQEEGLKEKITSNITTYYLWTSGRDAHTFDQFVWDSSENKSLANTGLTAANIDPRTSPLTCVGFWGGKYGLLPCTAKGHTLCDAPTP